MTNSIAIQGDYAYLGEGCGLTILDISNRSAPLVIGKTIPLPDTVESAFVVGDYAYLAAGESGLRIIDVSIPIQPVELGFFAPSTLRSAVDVEVTGKYAYLVGDQSLQIVV